MSKNRVSVFIHIYIYIWSWYIIKLICANDDLSPTTNIPSRIQKQIQMPHSHPLGVMLYELMPTIMMLTLVSGCVPFDQLVVQVKQYIRPNAEPSTWFWSIPLRIIEVSNCYLAILPIWTCRGNQGIVQMRTVFFWVITQRVVLILYRRFGTTYQSHLRRSGFLILEDGNDSNNW